MNIFKDKDSTEHYNNLLEHKMSYKDLVNDIPAESTTLDERLDAFLNENTRKTIVENSNQEYADDPDAEVPSHLQAKTTDERFNDPVRMSGVEGPRDVSQPFQATKKWHLEYGPDGRPTVVNGEQAEGGQKLSYDYEHGVVMVPKEEPTVLPEYKALGQRNYPGRRQ